VKIPRRTHPQAAARFYQGRHSGNHTAAILWLFLLLGALVVVRRGALPDPYQAATLLMAALAVVMVGELFPTPVLWLLVALLVAGVLEIAAPVSGLLGTVQAQLAGLGASVAPGTPTVQAS